MGFKWKRKGIDREKGKDYPVENMFRWHETVLKYEVGQPTKTIRHLVHVV